MVIFAKKTVVGWEEWVGLPDIGLPMIKAKVDTGAQTSCLHATNIKVIKRGDKRFVKFRINPIHKNKKLIVRCIAPLVDRRYVIDSGGHREKRYVIETSMIIGRKKHTVELTLTNRKTMAFRMLIGRQAMSIARLVVDPVKSCCTGKYKLEEVIGIYEQNLKEKIKKNEKDKNEDRTSREQSGIILTHQNDGGGEGTRS